MIVRLFQPLFGLALAFALIMAILPQSTLSVAPTHDKHLHALVFMVLATLALFSFPRTGLLRLFFGLALIGAVIEFVQAIPSLGRDSDLFDWLADLLGAGSIIVLAWLVRQRKANLKT